MACASFFSGFAMQYWGSRIALLNLAFGLRLSLRMSCVVVAGIPSFFTSWPIAHSPRGKSWVCRPKGIYIYICSTHTVYVCIYICSNNYNIYIIIIYSFSVRVHIHSHICMYFFVLVYTHSRSKVHNCSCQIEAEFLQCQPRSSLWKATHLQSHAS